MLKINLYVSIQRRTYFSFSGLALIIYYQKFKVEFVVNNGNQQNFAASNFKFLCTLKKVLKIKAKFLAN